MKIRKSLILTYMRFETSMAALTAVPAITWLVLSPFLVETPRYTLIEKHHDDKARKDLIKLRGTDEIDDELQELEKESLSEENAEVMPLTQLFTDKTLRWQLIIVLVGQLGQQLGGKDIGYELYSLGALSCRHWNKFKDDLKIDSKIYYSCCSS